MIIDGEKINLHNIKNKKNMEKENYFTLFKKGWQGFLLSCIIGLVAYWACCLLGKRSNQVSAHRLIISCYGYWNNHTGEGRV